jgi:hypothetical protein
LGLALSGLRLTELYAGYLAVGGTLPLDAVAAVLDGHRDAPALEHDYLAQALNDDFVDHGHNHPVAYTSELVSPGHEPDAGTPPGPRIPPDEEVAAGLARLHRRAQDPRTWLHGQVGNPENTTQPARAAYRQLLRRAVREDPDATVAIVAGLSWSVTDEHELLEFLQRTVDLATTVIGAADGAGVTANLGGDPFTAVSTHDRVLTVDAAQYLAGDGPCLHALRTGTVVHANHDMVRTRWPQFAPGAQDGGVQEFLASPLGEEHRWLGALNLYSTQGAGFTPQDTVLLQLLVNNATRSVQDYARLRAAHDLAAQLRDAMASRAPIEQAKGILMAAHGLDADAAFDLLRTRSQHTNTKLHHLARTFLDDHTRPPQT